ncbi:MAG: hypothetical protein GY856_52965, partial [bacterium]|nr:hypothetical protein [bacterium]
YLRVPPVGFDRASWAYETYDPARAVEIPVNVDAEDGLRMIELAPFLLDCGPAVDVLPEVASGRPLPPLREIAADAWLADPETGAEIPARITLDARDDRIELRNLPRGELRLAFRLSHPHFLPRATLSWEIDLKLENGSFAELRPLLDDVGGAVRVRGDGAAARLAPFGDGELRIEVIGDEALFPSLPAGTYEVTLCADPACAEAIRTWREVEIDPGKTLLLDD